MKYGNEPSPREEKIKRIELADTIVEQHIEDIRKFAALTAIFPERLRSSLIFEYAYHSIVYELRNDLVHFFPGWLYMEHAAQWMHKVLSQPLPEPEYRLDESEFLTLLPDDRETTPERELIEMQRFYQALEYMDEDTKWKTLFSYAHNKYVRGGSYEPYPLYETAEIVVRFYEWLQQQGAQEAEAGQQDKPWEEVKRELGWDKQ